MDGRPGETNPAKNNTALVQYGIQNERSDIRAHVSVVHRCIYVFQTQDGIALLEKHREGLKKRPAYQQGVEGPTATGYLMPYYFILPYIRVITLPAHWGWDAFSRELDTTEKGDRAVRCVQWSIENGHFPLWINNTKEAESKEIQIQGVDIIVHCHKRIQVKCDYSAGPKPGGTGNLFFQVEECNPLGKH